MFKRKVYAALAEWKEKYSGNYAAMLEGARRVGNIADGNGYIMETP